jgi:two-component system sensor histidine kinase KdpD
MSERERGQLAQNLRLAQQLGAETVTLTGESAADETIRYAKKRNVTKIVIGKPTHPRWKDLFGPSFLDVLVRTSGEADVYVISGDDRASAPMTQGDRPARGAGSRRGYLASVAVIAVATGLSWKLFG